MRKWFRKKGGTPPFVDDKGSDNNLHVVVQVFEGEAPDARKVQEFSVNFLSKKGRISMRKTAHWAMCSGYVMRTVPKRIPKSVWDQRHVMPEADEELRHAS